MGNRNCGLFNDGRDGDDNLFVDGLSDEENRTIKELYRNMEIASKIMNKIVNCIGMEITTNEFYNELNKHII
jgi:hypothetical protein